MSNPDDRYRRWLDDEKEARRLEELRAAAQERCDRALDHARGDAASGRADALVQIDRLEQVVERSLAFYLGHSANDAAFLEDAFGARRAGELTARLRQRKLSLLTELDRLAELRSSLQRVSPGPSGPGSD